jgi:hypothetical protein
VSAHKAEETARVKGRPGRIRAATIDNAGQSASQVRVLQRSVSVGPVVVSDITFLTDLTVDCDDVGAGFYVHLPPEAREVLPALATEAFARHAELVHGTAAPAKSGAL